MSKKSTSAVAGLQQLNLFNFPAESRPARKKPSRKPSPTVKIKLKRPDVVYSYQLTSKTPMMPIHRVSTGLAAKLLNKEPRSFRRGFTYRGQGFHGSTLIAIWAGTNPEDRRGSLWDIHVELAS